MFFSSLSSKFIEYLVRNWHRWLTVILLLVFPLFFIGGPDYYDSRSIKEVWNLGHFFYFSMVILVLDSYWCSNGRTIFFRIFASILVLVIVGVGIELIQLNFVGRYFSWSDVARDLSGGATALLWKTGRRRPRIQSAFSGLVLLVVLLFNFAPLGLALSEEYQGYMEFPLLAGFESKAELTRWECGRVGLTMVTSPRTQGRYSGKITLTTEKYSGLSLQHFPGDWSGWSGLKFNVFNPGRQVALHYRVHDHLHYANNQTYVDRFNRTTILDHGWNQIVIPMIDVINGPHDRKMDISKITGFGIFVMKQPERRVLYLDNVRLF